MDKQDSFFKQLTNLYARYKQLSTSKQVIIIVFVIWALQAIPKWTAAILADGETAAKIMTFFIPPG